MSTDAKVAKQILETLEDGKNGFAKGADKLAETDAPQLADTFRRYSAQRAQFAKEIEQLGQSYGDPVESSGSVAAAVHRGWLSLKDALAGSSPRGILEAAEEGEDHAVSEYEKALKEEVTGGFRELLERQFTEVTAAHAEVRTLRDAQA